MTNEVDSEMCRFCGTQDGFRVFIFDPGSDHMKRITSILPIEVSEADMLPKYMCYRCTYKLKEGYAFQQQCLKIDALSRSRLGLPLALQNGRSVQLDADLNDDGKTSDVLQGLPPARRPSGITSTCKTRSPGTGRKRCSYKKKRSKASVSGNKSGNTSSASVRYKPPDVKAESLLTPVKSLNKSELCKSVVEPGPSKSNGSLQSAVNEEVVNGASREKMGEVGVNSNSSAAKSEGSDNKIPPHIMVTKIPGSCSIYTCQICERCFVSEAAARNHSCDSRTEVQAPPSTASDTREYFCEHCNKTFTRYVSLLAHQEAHLRCFVDEEELEEEYVPQPEQPSSALPGDGNKKPRKRVLSTSSEEEATVAPSNL